MRIFVVGSGRCGSCWVGQILDSHPEIRCTNEREPMFQLARSLALWPSRFDELWPRLLKAYEREVAVAPELHYADKSHPLLWHWQDLVDVYPGAWFWVVRRDAEQTVSSMLKHGTIRHRFECTWAEVEFPSQTLGVGPGRKEAYSCMSLVERAAMRWAAHDCEAARLCSSYPRAIEIRYETLVQDGTNLLERARQQMGLSAPFPPHRPHRSSLGTALSEFDRRRMRGAIASFEPWW